MGKNVPKTIAIVFMGAVAAMGAGGAASLGGPGRRRPRRACSTRRSAAIERRRSAHGDDASKLLRCPAHVPAALDPPAGTTLAAGMAASGVQVYVCTAPRDRGRAPAWVLKAPHAVLSEGKETTATHFSGPAPVAAGRRQGAERRIDGAVASPASAPATAPTWEALDGSRLTGARVASAAAPDGKSIPWLLLRSTSSVGPGLFGDVTWVQRLDTVGGAAPAARLRRRAPGRGGDGAVSRGLLLLSPERGGDSAATLRVELRLSPERQRARARGRGRGLDSTWTVERDR